MPAWLFLSRLFLSGTGFVSLLKPQLLWRLTGMCGNRQEHAFWKQQGDEVVERSGALPVKLLSSKSLNLCLLKSNHFKRYDELSWEKNQIQMTDYFDAFKVLFWSTSVQDLVTSRGEVVHCNQLKPHPPLQACRRIWYWQKMQKAISSVWFVCSGFLQRHGSATWWPPWKRSRYKLCRYKRLILR